MMSKIIDAGAAKLAGLQIDSLQKYRDGQLTLGQWERFNNLSSEAREERFGDWKRSVSVTEKPTPKFTLLADLGIITVPADYDHRVTLVSFRKRNYKKFVYYNDSISEIVAFLGASASI
jgi:hypothetical protein